MPTVLVLLLLAAIGSGPGARFHIESGERH